MRNPLQEQLLKAGLAKKQQVDAAARTQARLRDGKIKPPPAAEQVNAQQLLAERAERDRALAAERNALNRERELRAQIRQIVESHKLQSDGEINYRFVDANAVKSILVSATQRSQLAKGNLVIVRHDPGYELLPRVAAQLIYERGGSVVVDHAQAVPAPAASADDVYYQKFEVPDDLIW